MEHHMSEVKTVHVMALSGEYQLTMRLLLAHQLKMQMRYVLDFLVLNPTFTNVDKKFDSLVRAFETYEELCGSFPTPETLANTKIRMFAYNKLAMNHLKLAVERFKADDHNDMPVDALEFVQHNFDDLCKLIETSSQHEYTLDEIRKAGV